MTDTADMTTGYHAADEPLVAVTTLVPVYSALEFQRRAVDLVADLTAEDLDDVGGFIPLDARTAVARYPDVWKLPSWGSGEDDVERAWWAWEDLGDGLRTLLRSFIANAGGVDGHKLASDAGYSASGIPAALKHLAMRCRRARRRPMWGYEDGTYMMDDQTKAVFDAVVMKADSLS